MLWLIIGGIGLFIGSLAFHPLWLQIRRMTATEGAHGGVEYTLRWEGERHPVEVFRLQNRLWIHPGSVGENAPTGVEIAIQGSEEVYHSSLPWNEEREAFGPSRFQVAPVHDVPLRIKIWREEELLWEGVRWSFRTRK